MRVISGGQVLARRFLFDVFYGPVLRYSCRQANYIRRLYCGAELATAEG